MRRIIAGIGLLFLLVACDPAITSGKVVNKDFEPGHYRTVNDPSTCVQRAKNGTCKVSVPRSHQEWVSPDWRIQLSNGKDTNWIDVTEAIYNNAEVGGCYAVKTC